MYMPKALMLVFVVDASRPRLFPVAKQHLHQLLASDPRLPLMVLANKQVSVTGKHSSFRPRLAGVEIKGGEMVFPGGTPTHLLGVFLFGPLSGPPRGLRHHRPPRRSRPVGGRGAQVVPGRYPCQKGPTGAQLRHAGRLGSDRPAGWGRQMIPVHA